MSQDEFRLPKPDETATSMQEAYTREILSELFLLQKQLTEIKAESTMRISITQDIINKHLEHGSKALDNYTQAANAHFSATKNELKAIADNEVKASITKSLLKAHKELLRANPPRINLGAVLKMTVIAALVGGVIGLGGGYMVYKTLNTERLTPLENHFIKQGRLLTQSWETLSPSAQQELEQISTQ